MPPVSRNAAMLKATVLIYLLSVTLCASSIVDHVRQYDNSTFSDKVRHLRQTRRNADPKSTPVRNFQLSEEDSPYSVLSCNKNSVEILINEVLSEETGAAMTVGSILTYLGHSRSFCVDCMPLLRTVVAVEPGPTEGSLLVHTSFLTYGDVFAEGQVPRGGTVADVEIEPIFSCLHSREVTTVAVAKMDLSADNHMRNLQNDLPSDCSGMTEVKNGRCVYTNCFVGGTEENNADCYFKGESCNNGCGSDSIQGITDFGLWSFARPCCIHDHCYSTGFSQKECDDEFLEDMNEECGRDPVAIAAACAFSGALFCCPTIAALYYGLVAAGGSTSYKGAQSSQSSHESSTTCIECDLQLVGIPTGSSVQCDAVLPPASPSATSECTGSPTISFSQVSTLQGCPHNYNLRRTWIATDPKGSSVSGSQTLEVRDTAAPALSAVPDETTQCSDQVPNRASPVATDNCDTNPSIVYQESSQDGKCADEYTLTRTWTATDACGNESDESQTLSIVDTNGPVIASIPLDTVAECDAVPIPAVPSASDNCDPNPSITLNEERTDGTCPNSYSLLRTWTVVDRCDNLSSSSQVVDIQDSTVPTWSGIPESGVAQCDSVPNPASPVATDNCDTNPSIVYQESRQDGKCADEYTLTRTWTATDACGNDSDVSQTLSIVDTDAPVLADVPFDTVAECDAVPIPAVPTAFDTCDPNPSITLNEERTDGTCPNSYSLLRTWTVVDRCDNLSSSSQVVDIRDTTGPVISCNQRNIAPNERAVEFHPSATDNCDNTESIEVKVISFSCWKFNGNSGKRNDMTKSCGVLLNGDKVVLTRTLGVGTNIAFVVQATDACGNIATTETEECLVVVQKPSPGGND